MANVFYVSEMNATSASDAAATFGESAAAQPSVSYATITTIAKDTLIALTADVNNVSTAGVSTYFSFYLDITAAIPTFVGVTNNVAAAFPTLVTASTANSTSAIDKKNITDDYTKLSAKFIFGSEEASGLFTNITAMNTGYDTALTAVGGAVNTTLGNNTSTKADASNKLVGQIAVNYIERFALMYRAASVASGSAWNGATAAGQFTADTTHTGCTVTQFGGAAATSHATIAVKIGSTAGEIEALYITSNADQWTSNTGAGYVAGRSISISKTIGNALCIVKIPTINAVQAAILNGTLDNSVLYSLTKDAVLFDTSLNVGTGANGVALVGGTAFASANGIASTALTGGVSNSGAGATFDVIMNTDNTVSSIRINATGANYVVSNNVILTQGASTITMTLSAAMIEVLNGAANAGYATFPTPLASDGKTSNIAIDASGSGTGARVDVTMADKYNIETIANSSYSYPWTNTATTGTVATGNYTTTVGSGGASQNGAGATFRVVITSGSITSIRRTGKNPTTSYVTGNVLTLTLVGGTATITLTALDATTTSILNGGSGYAANEVITISSGSPAQKITATLTATTAAILNGTANALTTESTPGLILATNLPLEAGDKIRMQQGVSQASGQKNTRGETVSFAQTAFVDYLLG
jgi:hypothetical protein